MTKKTIENNLYMPVYVYISLHNSKYLIEIKEKKKILVRFPFVRLAIIIIRRIRKKNQQKITRNLFTEKFLWTIEREKCLEWTFRTMISMKTSFDLFVGMSILKLKTDFDVNRMFSWLKSYRHELRFRLIFVVTTIEIRICRQMLY